MGQFVKRKSAPNANGVSNQRSKKQRTVANGTAHPKAYKPSNPKSSNPKSVKPKSKPESSPKVTRLESEKDESDFDGFTSDEEDGGVPLPKEDRPTHTQEANGISSGFMKTRIPRQQLTLDSIKQITRIT